MKRVAGKGAASRSCDGCSREWNVLDKLSRLLVVAVKVSHRPRPGLEMAKVCGQSGFHKRKPIVARRRWMGGEVSRTRSYGTRHGALDELVGMVIA